MRKVPCYLTLGLISVMGPGTLISATPAAADCTNAGAATVCAQGEVRGGGPTAPIAGPAYPGYCADPWYCDDGWNLDLSLRPNPGPGPSPRPPRPGPRN
ncbi:hypothetical protein MHEL_13500 [Mycolicibacterium helvum]|uniref:Secreted protein n=1 Tax=Mycolicibacterium helvum TaxID=1534349 RepID=A0A7I7T1F5_9MYCO|nr:hypothetical protein MHEL_13500 [Mycolicibacterium helvum]